MDDAKLYVGAEITDPQLTRTARIGESDDHVSMTLAFPAGRGGLKAYEIGFYAGKPGDSPGAVKWLAGPNKGQDVRRREARRERREGRLHLRGGDPVVDLPRDAHVRVGLHGRCATHDGDGSSVRGVLGTGPGGVDHPAISPRSPPSPSSPWSTSFLSPKNLLGTAPKIDVFADVTGDELKERISVFDHFLTIFGPGYRGGQAVLLARSRRRARVVRDARRDRPRQGRHDRPPARRAAPSPTSGSRCGRFASPATSRPPLHAGDRGRRRRQAARHQRRARLVQGNRRDRRAGAGLGRDVVPRADRRRRRAHPPPVGHGASRRRFRFEKEKFEKERGGRAGRATAGRRSRVGTGTQPQPKPQETCRRPR